jgi:hypothetical protein
VEIQIDKDLFIAPVTDEERESSMLYSNHSCNPNLGIRGEITFVAMRDIRAGEELTHDWAITDDDDYSVDCKCGAPNCRKILTGKDWQRPELQSEYAGYFSAYLTRKIATHCYSDPATCGTPRSHLGPGTSSSSWGGTSQSRQHSH